MIAVKIVSPALRTQPYTNKRTGQPATLSFQTAYLFTVNEKGEQPPFPEKLEFIAERDDAGNPKPYAAGDYTLHPSSVYIDRDGRLAASLRLTPKRTA